MGISVTERSEDDDDDDDDAGRASGVLRWERATARKARHGRILLRRKARRFRSSDGHEESLRNESSQCKPRRVDRYRWRRVETDRSYTLQYRLPAARELPP
jgi:hypothetical protein